MDIKDLQPRQGNAEVTGEIIDKGDVREWEKFGKAGKVCTAVLRDETGEVKLSLWNEQVDEVNKGDKVKVTNGWVGEYQGEKQLSTGKFGKLEVLEKGSGEPKESAPEEPVHESKEETTEEDLEEEPVDNEEEIE